jgi:hypothetical protein
LLVPLHWSNVEASDRPSFEGSTTHAIANTDSEAMVDHMKEKEKLVGKKKEPIRIGHVELVYLSDKEVVDWKLSDNNDIDDEAVPNLEGMDVGDSVGICSQTVDPNLGKTRELVPVP